MFGNDLSLLETILSKESDLNLELINTSKLENVTMKYVKDEPVKIISIESKNRKVDVVCVEGTIEKIEYLLTKNLVNLKFELSISNLFKLLEKTELEPLKMLLKDNFINKYYLECCDNSGQRPLHYAALRGFTETIRFLLPAGVKINSHDNANETLLHKVVSEKDIKLFTEEYKKADLDLNNFYFYQF